MGREVGVAELEEADYQMLKKLTTDFAAHFGYNVNGILKYQFLKLFPLRLRPYGPIYAH
ncbi:MAG TPA: hypothetical protein VMW37_04620 [Dehalococcoidales bacterium]|nr:hypothetical protein [Dehalococcoidales bacterium]